MDYLLFHPMVFEYKDWGTASAAHSTVNRLIVRMLINSMAMNIKTYIIHCDINLKHPQIATP